MDENSQVPPLTFNSLYNILREEKKNKFLQNLHPQFYLALDKYFEDKKKELEELKKENEPIDKIRKEERVLENSRKIAVEILKNRFNKIANYAIENAFSYGDVINVEELNNDKELKIYNEIKKLVEGFKF
jgi:DNA replication initiation complex subunit (GINS family)